MRTALNKQNPTKHDQLQPNAHQLHGRAAHGQQGNSRKSIPCVVGPHDYFRSDSASDDNGSFTTNEKNAIAMSVQCSIDSVKKIQSDDMANISSLLVRLSNFGLH